MKVEYDIDKPMVSYKHTDLVDILQSLGFEAELLEYEAIKAVAPKAQASSIILIKSPFKAEIGIKNYRLWLYLNVSNADVVDLTPLNCKGLRKLYPNHCVSIRYSQEFLAKTIKFDLSRNTRLAYFIDSICGIRYLLEKLERYT